MAARNSASLNGGCSAEKLGPSISQKYQNIVYAQTAYITDAVSMMMDVLQLRNVSRHHRLIGRTGTLLDVDDLSWEFRSFVFHLIHPAYIAKKNANNPYITNFCITIPTAKPW